MSITNQKDWSQRDPLEKAFFLLYLEKSKTFKTLDRRDEAEKELFGALGVALQVAEKAEKEANKSLFIEAINSFKRLLTLFEEHQFMQEAWAEVLVVVAICYFHLSLDEHAEYNFQKAINLEPDNQKIREIGIHYGWIEN